MGLQLGLFFKELLKEVGFSDETLYEEFIKEWCALNANRKEEFRLCLTDELVIHHIGNSVMLGER